MNHLLTDFLNHGHLPFTGRGDAIDRIVEFWRETPNSHGLRVMLMTGEAGIGKSRLIAEAIPSIMEANGAVVAVKLYAGGSTSLAPLLARGIWTSSSGRRLLKREPEGTIQSVAEALCHMGRLRPLLVIIEDIHLLSGGPLRDFARLLEIISEEMISLLCLARPVEEVVRGIVERFITHELSLTGLDERGVVDLWKALFSLPPDRATLHAFQRVTLGNPLALRSALRGATSSGSITEDASIGGWGVAVPLPSFVAGVERHVRLLLEGMAAHLTPSERSAAGVLASLGEIFSREAAEVLISDCDALLEGLVFKGIITTSGTTRPPLSGVPSAHPLLSFAHTLMYNQLAHGSSIGMESVVQIIARDLPVYSVVPYELLCRHGVGQHISSALVIDAVGCAITAAEALDITSDWILGGTIAEAAIVLAESHLEGIDDERLRELQAAVLRVRLTTLRRENHTPHFARLVERLEEVAGDAPTERLAQGRLDALRFGIWSNRQNFSPRFERWDDVDHLLVSFPRLIVSEAYVLLLKDVASLEHTHESSERRRDVEHRLEAAVASKDATDEFRLFAVNQIAIHFLAAFDSEQELEKRLQLLAEMESTTVGRQGLLLQAVKIPFLEAVGRINEMLAAIDLQLPLLQKLGFKHTWPGLKAMRLTGEGALGGDLDQAFEDARSLSLSSPAEMVPRVRQTLGERLELTAILRNDPGRARRFASEFLGDAAGDDLRGIATDLLEENLDGVLRRAIDGRGMNGSLAAIAEAVFRNADHGSVERATSELRPLLGVPLLRLNDLLTVRVAIDLATLPGRSNSSSASIPRDLQEDVTDAVRRALAWLATCRLHCYMRAFLERYREHIPGAEAAEWEARIFNAESLGTRQQESILSERGRTRVTMLGTITVMKGRSPVIKLRTGRLRPLLGLLIADRMLDTPLSHREFCRLVSGIDGDHERGRKATNLAVFRLREILGHDAIITDGETPQLNTELVAADILDVHDHLKEAGRFIRHGPLMPALPALIAALDLVGGEVPFPGLYEEFFEALREDLDYRLRSTLLSVAARLLDEGDADSAESILRRGFEAMPDDEEVAELLCESLRALGRNTDAERVRMKCEV